MNVKDAIAKKNDEIALSAYLGRCLTRIKHFILRSHIPLEAKTCKNNFFSKNIFFYNFLIHGGYI